MKTHICIFILMFSGMASVAAQPYLRGRVLAEGEKGTTTPLVGASLHLLKTKGSTHTDARGNFRVRMVSGEDTLLVSYVGYISQRLQVVPRQDLQVILQQQPAELQEVEVSTGYYSIPKERATGSFTHIDNELLSRSVSANILDRLEGVTNGLQFDRRNLTGENVDGEPELRIRGLSTIESDSRPLIIVDNFPYEGDLSALNPNDVEGVTILKDAAAASIWGARAGNGVIVISTKQGHFNEPATVSFSSSVNVVQKPDLFYNQNVLPPATMMNIQQELFGRGAYPENPQTPIPAYVELLIKQRDGLVSAADFDRQKMAMQQIDIRNEALEYLYQPAINQQYALNVSGGGSVHRYYLSGGYDADRAQLIGNQAKRLNLSMQNTFKVRPELELTAGVWYTNQQRQNNAVTGVGWDSRNAYSRLMDDEGNALPLVRKYRTAYLETAESQGLLDWMYRPVDELNLTDNTSGTRQIRMNGVVKYQFLKYFGINASYQYLLDRTYSDVEYDKDSYYARDLVNRLTQPDGSKIIPIGAVLKDGTTDDGMASDVVSHAGRFQVNYQQSFAGTHDLTALAGAELSQMKNWTLPGNVYYAYDTETGYGQNSLSYSNAFYQARPSGYAAVPQYGGGPTTLNTNRNLSYFGNVSYTYNAKYILSGSARWDGSNLLGVKTNQRGTALWSAGGSWEVSKEPFYLLGQSLPYLRLRVTYGSAGNIDKSQSYYPTISTDVDPYTLLPYSVLVSPGNPSLRWEQVNTLNVGADWRFRDKRVTGSVEYFIKQANYLMGNRLKDPTLGFGMYDNYKENYGDMCNHGLDFELNSRNLVGSFKWESTLLLNYSNNKITKIDDQPFTTTVDDYFSNSGVLHPIKGRSLDELYAIPWHGLNPETGEPMIYINNLVSNDYVSYYSGLKPDDLTVSGLGVAPWYGSLRNSFAWKGLQLGVLISFKAGHVFQRASMLPGAEYNTSIQMVHMDYFERWQKPGDEKFTDVPAHTDAYEEQRAWVYQYSTVLITPADAIRLQDIRLSYSFNSSFVRRLSLQNLRVYAYARNLGIIWRANKQGLDPDYPNAAYPAPKSFAIGLQTNF